MTALLFTRAVPFPDCRNPANVLGRLVKGKLPTRPTGQSTQFHLSDAWWKICTSCWRRDPSSRPTMKDVIEKIKTATVRTLRFHQVPCALTAFLHCQTDPAMTSLGPSAPVRPISKEAGGHPISGSRSLEVILRQVRCQKADITFAEYK